MLKKDTPGVAPKKEEPSDNDDSSDDEDAPLRSLVPSSVKNEKQTAMEDDDDSDDSEDVPLSKNRKRVRNYWEVLSIATMKLVFGFRGSLTTMRTRTRTMLTLSAPNQRDSLRKNHLALHQGKNHPHEVETAKICAATPQYTP